MIHKSLKLFSSLAWLVGIVGILMAILMSGNLFRVDPLPFLVLVVLSVFLEMWPVQMGDVLSSLIMAVPLGMVAAFNGSYAIWIPAVAFFISAVAVQRRSSSWHVIVFNVGQYCLSSLALVKVFHALMQTNEAPRSLNLHVAYAMAIAGIVFILVNHLLLNLLSSAIRKFSIRSALKIIGIDILNLAFVYPFSIFMVLLRPLGSWLTVVALIPLVVLAYTLRTLRILKDMQMVHETTIRLTSEFDLTEIGKETARVIKKLCNADEVVVFQLNMQTNVLVPIAVNPEHRFHNYIAVEESSTGIPQSSGGLIWSVLNSRQPVYVPDTRKDQRVRWIGNDGQQLLSMLVVPLHSHGKAQGAIVLYSKRTFAFKSSMDYATALGAQVSVLMENARLYQELNERSIHDEATGLYNYRYFYQQLEKRMAYAVSSKTPLCVSILDIDFFKKFNDTYGHLAGDVVLREVGKKIEEIVGESALVARYGGEEFALVLPMPLTEAFELIEKIRRAVAGIVVEYGDFQLQGITVSIGLAAYPEHSSYDRDLLSKADSAMYWGAKKRGRNRSAIYLPEFDNPNNIDGLTGLYKHHFINMRVSEMIAQGIVRWGLVCIDIKDFNSVNTRFGFSTGNQVLYDFAQRLRDTVRHGELACRYGGDEFLLLVPDAQMNEMESIANRLENVLTHATFDVAGNVALRLKISMAYQYMSSLHESTELFDEVGRQFALISSHLPLVGER